METYTVIGSVVTINTGLLELNKGQAEPRMHALEKTEEAGIFRVANPTHFKRGESFGYEGPPLSKVVLVNLAGEGEESIESASVILPVISEDDEIPSVSSEEGSDDVMTVKQLGELLNLSVKDTIALLSDYEFVASAYNSKVPVSLVEQVLDEYQSADAGEGAEASEEESDDAL